MARPSISVDVEHGSATRQCSAGLCSNGTHLFVRIDGDTPEIVKIGTGLNGTTLGRVYNSVLCSKLGAECAARAWIGSLGSNFLLLQGAKSHTVLVLSADDLSFHSTIHITPSDGCTESAFYTTAGMELHCVELWNNDALDDNPTEAEHVLDRQSTLSTDRADTTELTRCSSSGVKLLDRVVHCISTFESTKIVESSPDVSIAGLREYSALSSALRSLPVCAFKQDVAGGECTLLNSLPAALDSPRDILQLLQTDAFIVLLTQEGKVWVRNQSTSLLQLRDHGQLKSCSAHNGSLKIDQQLSKAEAVV